MGGANERRAARRARTEARQKAEEEAARPPAHEATPSVLRAIDEALGDAA